jgi:hypothetical protein
VRNHCFLAKATSRTSGRVSALQAQSPEFEPQPIKKKNNKKKSYIKAISKSLLYFL